MALEVGSRPGCYDVTALIGEGGMGQVCDATDTKLDQGRSAEGVAVGPSQNVARALNGEAVPPCIW